LAVPPNFYGDSGLVMPPHRVAILIICGQDYKDDTFEDGGVIIVQIMCREFNGTDTTLTAYKDGMEFRFPIQFGPVPPPSNDIFGTYTFVAENNCGRDVKVTRISRRGQFLYIYIHM